MSDTTAEPYADRLRRTIDQRGRLCVGIDPHPSMLRAWDLPLTAEGLEQFVRTMVNATAETVAVVKPNAAPFEMFGAAGIAVLERAIADLRQAGALVLLDAKRGDIGSTMEDYALAYLGDAPLAVDAITVNPFLGIGALEPAMRLARQNGRGLYILCRTSNPESGQVQTAWAGKYSVATRIAQEVMEANRPDVLGPFGLVVGATLPKLDVDLAEFNGSILSPGIGAQGATMEGAKALFGDTFGKVIPAVSRSVMQAGPDAGALAETIADAIAAAR